MVCDAVVSDTQVPTSWWNLAFPSSGLEGKNSCIMKRGAAGSSKLFGSSYQTSWSHIPWLYSEQTEVPITYHMPRFNISTRVVELHFEFLKRYALSFSLHKTHCERSRTNSQSHLPTVESNLRMLSTV